MVNITSAQWIRVTVVVIMLALITGGGWFHQSQKRAWRQEVEKSLFTIAELKANQLSAWRKEQFNNAAVLSENEFFVQGVDQFVRGGSPVVRRKLLSLLQSLKDHYQSADILLVDPEGKQILSLSGQQQLSDVILSALPTVFREKKTVFVDLHRGSVAGGPQVSVLAPLYSGDSASGKAIGAVIMVINASQFLYPLVQTWPTNSETAETLLVRRHGDDVLFLNDLRHQKDTALRLRIPLGRSDLPASKAILGKTGIVQGADYRGVDVLAAILAIPDSNWFMVSKVDTVEAFAAWYNRSLLIIVFVLGLILSTGAVGLFWWQRIRRDHFRALYLSELALHQSAERHSVTLKSIGDAVIATDGRGLVELLNPVAELLTGWTEAEAVGRPLGEVFRLVDERTGEEVESPVTKVLRERAIVALANHTTLISRDGTRRPIADSGAPISNDKGEITGVVLVFRDQAEEKRTQRMAQVRWNLIEYAASCSLAELMTKGLDEVAIIFDSPIGFFHYVEADQETISLQQWSTRTRAEFCHAEGESLHYPLSEAGVWADCVREGKPVVHNDYGSLSYKKGMPEGHAEVFRELSVPIKRDNRVVAILGIGNKPSDYSDRDVESLEYIADIIWEIVERKKAELALKRREKKYRLIIKTAIDGFWLTDLDGRLLEVNEAYCRMSGYSEEELLSMNIVALDGVMDTDDIILRIEEVLHHGLDRFETKHRRKDGSLYDVDVSVQHLASREGKLVVILRDITMLKEAEQENKLLQAQLMQAQKMEAIGRLAGGVAHDFNNMLSVIIGYSELAKTKIGPSGELYSDLDAILSAARRSTDITRKLLAFARRQTIQPKVLDLNQVVESMLAMIRRLIGEDIDLVWHPDAKLWPVKIDPTQLEQILANLCVNARDAIVGVGKVTIETHPAVFDEAYCRDHVGFIPGGFVLLAVSDSGCGMDRQTLEKIFEPFFTTKDESQGTGLGLATVYGIVKQNSGFVNVYSEPGEGTTFKIYLPKHIGELDVLKPEDLASEIKSINGETVLFVEDEPAIMDVGKSMLEQLGYTVYAAGSPEKAIRLAAEYSGKIHLLITDVVMPGMNGRELANQLQSLYPGMRVLFMSGYTADIIAHRGVLDEGVQFIHKPFAIKELSHKVREILDGGGI